MKVLRVELTQNKAHYRKEESLTNKMTYPLPPFSTVIGALHNACGFKEYHEMDLSIQGNFTSLIKQPYTDHCFLDSVMDDRGILVKLKNSSLQSTAFEKVASAMKSQGNSFRKNISIQIHNKKLMEEYRSLKDLNDQIDIFKIRINNGKQISSKCREMIIEQNSLSDSKEDKNISKKLKDEIQKYKKDKSKGLKELFKVRKKSVSEKKKKFDKKSDEFKKLSDREKELKAKEKFINEKIKEFEHENYTKEISRYTSLTTSLRFYEVLHDIELIIHIKASDETLKKIEENIYSLKSIGRSEDFVDVKECKLVELSDEIDTEMTSKYSAYLNYELVKNENIYMEREKNGTPASGTKYWINKVYDNSTGKRDFSKGKKIVLYASNYSIDEESKGVYFDSEGKYIVNFN